MGAHRIARLVLISAIGLAVLVLGAMSAMNLTGPARADEDNPVQRNKPSVTAFPAVAKLHSRTKLVFAGTGFAPGEEVRILLGDAYGNTSDVTGWLVTASGEVEETGADDAQGVSIVRADASGNFAGGFAMGRFERTQYEAPWGITVTDTDYNAIATTPLVFCDPDGRSRAGVYKRRAPDYEKNPDDPRPAPFCAGLFEYPERPGS
jgi:hypothetical protein